MSVSLITGADGLLGATLTRELLGRGERVRALVEPGAPARTLADLDVELVETDLSKAAPLLADAARGCDTVFHVAAVTSPWAPDALTWAVNLDGTRWVLEAARGAGAKLIAVGTANTLSPRGPGSPGDETGELPEMYRPLVYARSKKAATDLVLEAARAGELDAVAIAPTFMLGGHVERLSSAQLVLEAVKLRPPFATPGGKNVVHVRDVARLMISARERGRSGELYLAGNADISYLELLTLIADCNGHRRPMGTLPALAVRAAGRLGSAWARCTGSPTRLTRTEAHIAIKNAWYDVSKADRELGLERTPIEEAVRDCLDGLRRYGHLPT